MSDIGKYANNVINYGLLVSLYYFIFQSIYIVKYKK